MCLRAQGIDDEDGGIGKVGQARGLSNDEEGVGRGRGIYDASKELETTAKAALAIQQAEGIYNHDRGVDGGR